MQTNSPKQWLPFYPRLEGHQHKYNRGHAVIYGAPELTGATRLAAEACARMGAGLTTVLCTAETAEIYRTTLPAHIMVRDDLDWHDDRVTAHLYGPGGLPRKTTYNPDIPTVLDAAALRDLPLVLGEHFILTPHEGEFAEAFPDLEGTKKERAMEAASILGSVIIVKGPDTVIAHPDGRAVENTNAPATLATAGSGDVLAGMITGLLAQGMPFFEAACAAVWIHGECANRSGVGLVASDLPGNIPYILQETLGISEKLV